MNLKQLIDDTVQTDWKMILLEIDTKSLDEFLTNEKNMFEGTLDIYPSNNLIFNCFNHFNISNTMVVIIGQDPYIHKGEAMGLSFSVQNNIKLPFSLKNIYKEIYTDVGKKINYHNGDLTHWAQQGILLLNSALTVREGQSNSHQKQWTPYTDIIIKKMSDLCHNLVFILWGRNAQNKIKLIDQNKHHIIKGVHPSPLSANRGFFGCQHFSKCNEILESIGKKPIQW